VFVQYLAPLLHTQDDIFGCTKSYLGRYIWIYCFIFRMVWLALLPHIEEGMVGTTASYSGWYD
jgi:hypothetical protein